MNTKQVFRLLRRLRSTSRYMSHHAKAKAAKSKGRKGSPKRIPFSTFIFPVF